MERPEPKMEAALMESPRLRAQRYADRLDELSTDPDRTIRGVRRPSLDMIELIPGYEIETINPNVLKALERKLGKYRPVFDRFTRHYRIFPPTDDKIDRFIYGAQNRNKQWSQNPEEQRQIIADRKRQPRDIEDNMQRTVFRDLIVARVRRASITTVQNSLKADHGLDPEATLMVADAINDFGYCLAEDKSQVYLRGFRFFPTQPKSGGDELTGPLIGAHIAFIGQQVSKSPELLRQNPVLLELVHREQTTREQYWGKIYSATASKFGDRLSDTEQQEAGFVNQELMRLASLQEAA